MKRLIVSEDMLLVHAFTSRMNGANVHRGTALLRSYQNALDLANDCRNSNRAQALATVARATEAMQRFR